MEGCQRWPQVMSELQILESALDSASRRRRWHAALQGLGRGLTVGAGVLLAAIAAGKLLPLPSQTVTVAGGLAVTISLAACIHGAWRRQSRLETARWIDDRKLLKERLSTALELSTLRAPEEWKGLLLADAARHAQALKPAELLPLQFPRAARWAILLLALCAGLGFVPAYRTKAQQQRALDAANIKDVGRNLTELMRRELVQKPPVLPATEKSMERVTELGGRLEKQTLTRSEALHDLASVTEQISQQQQELARNPALKPLERAAREPGGGGMPASEAIRKQIDALQKALGDAAAHSDKLDKLARDLAQLKQQAANMANKDSQGGSAARQQMAQSLADLARQAREAGASLDQLEEAIQALASNNTDLFLKDLQAATHDLEKLRDMAKAMQQLQEQKARVGRDLVEQLEKGQAQAAAQTLQKMIDQLKTGSLSPDQLQKIQAEVSKAAKPGSDYGKVGDFLNKAGQQCQAGNKPGAAQSLAEAQAELQKLMDQMADAQSLESTLDALARAQMAVSQCKGWGQCKSGGGYKPGGKPGRGVGTWAEEEGTAYQYFSENQGSGWDNTGIERPDVDSKGHTDRPDGLNPNLVPDKVKGRLSPGGSMPSITLKGVSIKGTSTVKFEEAAASAQQEAQSALNQDQVPRAYQNAVRDYFDDLKK